MAVIRDNKGRYIKGSKQEFSEESRAKISEALRKRPPPSEETRRKIGESSKNRVRPPMTVEHEAKFRAACQRPEAIEKRRQKHLGKIVSEETRRKIGLSSKGRKMPPEAAEKARTRRLGCKHSEVTKSKIGKAHTGQKRSQATRDKLSGPNHYNWKGGKHSTNLVLRNSLESKDWKKAVFCRDDYTCQMGGQRGGVLRVHHIFSFHTHGDLRFDVSNGITLSQENHFAFHSAHTTKNNTLYQLEEFLGRELPQEQRQHLISYEVASAVESAFQTENV